MEKATIHLCVTHPPHISSLLSKQRASLSSLPLDFRSQPSPLQCHLFLHLFSPLLSSFPDTSLSFKTKQTNPNQTKPFLWFYYCSHSPIFYLPSPAKFFDYVPPMIGSVVFIHSSLKFPQSGLLVSLFLWEKNDTEMFTKHLLFDKFISISLPFPLDPWFSILPEHKDCYEDFF